MQPTFNWIEEHMRLKHANHSEDLTRVMRECYEAGFSPIFISYGLEVVFKIPYGEAKRLVASHFFRGDARENLERLHSELEEMLPEGRQATTTSQDFDTGQPDS